MKKSVVFLYLKKEASAFDLRYSPASKGCGQRGGLTSSPVLGLTHTLFSHPPALSLRHQLANCTQERLGPGAKPRGGHRRCPCGASAVGSRSLPRPGDVPSGMARVTTRQKYISKL
ncbi:unnamed protein product [Rangifer tarandus platyrhynchus]|uniref:Uncharacterized protein n=1 Tax=Rangifer tarandus platyrhynchus TaxID=3082113 RepID=A0AC59Z429_RANTA